MRTVCLKQKVRSSISLTDSTSAGSVYVCSSTNMVSHVHAHVHTHLHTDVHTRVYTHIHSDVHTQLLTISIPNTPNSLSVLQQLFKNLLLAEPDIARLPILPI